MGIAAFDDKDLRPLVVEMVVDHLADRVLSDYEPSQDRSRLLLFPGYDSDVVEHLVERLRRSALDICIKVDSEYTADVSLPVAVVLDPRRESFTQYRNRRDRHTVLMPKNAYGQEWESLEAVETVEQDDLRDRVDEFVRALPGAQNLFGPELNGLVKLMHRLVKSVNPTLQECLEFLLEVHELRRNGIPTAEALGESLPRLKAFRQKAAFAGLNLENPKAKTLDSIIHGAVEQSRNFAERVSSSGLTLTTEELQDNLLVAREEISDRAMPILERYVSSSVRDDKARKAALELDWVEDGVQFLFQRPRKATSRLGERTLAHLELSTMAALESEDRNLLQKMDEWRSVSDTNRLRLEGFYTRFQPHIEAAPKLNDSWRRLIYKRDVRDLDFLAALLRSTDEVIDPDRLEATDFPLRLRITAEVQTVADIIDRFSHEAITFFATRYRGLNELLGPAVELNFGGLSQAAAYAHTYTSGQELPEEIREKVKDFVEADRSKDKANHLFFQTEILNAEGETVEGGKKRFVWTFEHSSFLAGFAEDMRRHSKHPLRRYRLPRALSSRKGVKLPVALDEPECVDVVGDRKRGQVTTTLLEGGAEDLRQTLEGAVNRLLVEKALTGDQATEAQGVIGELDDLLRQAFDTYLSVGLAWEGWEDFAGTYAELLDRLLEAGQGGRYAKEVLAPIATIGTARVSEEDAVIVSPTQPLRLIGLFAKAQQVAATLTKWLVSPDVEYIDPEMYIKTLVRDLAHPYYPEILTDNAQALLATSATLGDYSLLTRVQETYGRDGRSHVDEPKEAARVLSRVTQNYLNLHPHERKNLSIVSHSVASQGFPQVLTEELNASTNREGSESHTQLFIRDVDHGRLRATYRSFLSNIEPEGVITDNDAPFDSRVSVMAIPDLKDTNLESGDVDIAFLLDQVAAHATVHWRSMHAEVARPSLAAHYPARWGTRVAHDPAEQFSASYLCCPTSPAVVGTFYRMVRAAVTHEHAEAETSTPVRRVDYDDTRVSAPLEEVHSLAQWVVNYDAVLDRRQLNRLGINVIRYRPAFDEGRSLVISSRQPNYVVLDHIRRRLESMDLLQDGADSHDAVREVWKAANTLSGGLVLRAAGKGYFVNELIGAILSQELLKRSIPADSVQNAIWVYLDDYGSWFRHTMKITDDLSQTDKKALADVLCIVPERVDGRLVLRVLISEAKVIDSGSNVAYAEQRSRDQLQATHNRFDLILGSRSFDDQEAWRLRLGNLIVNAGQSSSEAAGFDLEEIRSLIHVGKVEFRLESHSHIFCNDPSVAASKHPVPTTENAWQWVFPQDKFRQIFKDFLRRRVPTDQALLQEESGEGDERSEPGEPTFKAHPDNLTEEEPSTREDLSHQNHDETVGDGSDTTTTPHAVQLTDDAKRYSKWAGPRIAEFLASLREQYPPSGDAAGIEKHLLETEAKVKELFPRYGIRTELGQSTVTPNAFRIRIQGQYDLTAAKLEKYRDQLLTVKGLKLTHIELESGYFALSFEREDRRVVPYLDCLDERTVTSVGANTAIILGRREDNGELLYHDFENNDPHALIGGTTGGGKSVLLATMITDLLMTNDPERLRLILVDPKKVELAKFGSVPHLHGSPLIDTPHDTLQTLADLVEEMEQRFSLMKDDGVTDITEYNLNNAEHPMRRIIMFFDEFADWMSDKNFRTSAEGHFLRLAGKARAAGIHLVLATQRPDNSVVSPILRANLAAKIALKVDKEANSNIILDEGGAERLLGKGHGIAKLAGKRTVFQSTFVEKGMLTHIANSMNDLYSPAAGGSKDH